MLKLKLIIFLIFVISAWPACYVKQTVDIKYKVERGIGRRVDTIVIYKYNYNGEGQDTIRHQRSDTVL